MIAKEHFETKSLFSTAAAIASTRWTNDVLRSVAPVNASTVRG